MDEYTQSPKKPAMMGGMIALGVVVVVLLVIGIRGRGTSQAKTGEPFKAQLVSGDGTQRRSSDSGGFVAVSIPCEVASRDMFLFGGSPRNVVSLPANASLRFSDSAEVGVDHLGKSGDRYNVALTLSNGRMWVKTGPEYDLTVSAKKAVLKAQPDSVFEVTQQVDEKAYAVTTLKVFKGSVEMSGHNAKSDHQKVGEGQTAKVNDDKMFQAEPFDLAKLDEWETWNVSGAVDSTTAQQPAGTSTTTTTTTTTTTASAPQAASTTSAAPTPAPSVEIHTTSGVIPAPPPQQRPGTAPAPQQPQPQMQAPQQQPYSPPPPPPPPGLEKPVYASGPAAAPTPVQNQNPPPQPPGNQPQPPPGQPGQPGPGQPGPGQPGQPGGPQGGGVPPQGGPGYSNPYQVPGAEPSLKPGERPPDAKPAGAPQGY